MDQQDGRAQATSTSVSSPTTRTTTPINTQSAQQKSSHDEREATELGPIERVPGLVSRNSSMSTAADVDAGPVDQARKYESRWYHSITAFWNHYINLAVPNADCRDHLGRNHLTSCFPIIYPIATSRILVTAMHSMLWDKVNCSVYLLRVNLLTSHKKLTSYSQ